MNLKPRLSVSIWGSGGWTSVVTANACVKRIPLWARREVPDGLRTGDKQFFLLGQTWTFVEATPAHMAVLDRLFRFLKNTKKVQKHRTFAEWKRTAVAQMALHRVLLRRHHGRVGAETVEQLLGANK